MIFPREAIYGMSQNRTGNEYGEAEEEGGLMQSKSSGSQKKQRFF